MSSFHDMLNEPQELKSDMQSSVTLSPFSLPSDDSDLHCSYEDLNNSLSQTHLSDDIQDTQDQDTAPSSIAAISLTQLLVQFPDLPSFIHHAQFPIFTNLWLDFQKHAALAKEPCNREYVQTWLTSSALQIHYLMSNLAKSSLDQDPESCSRKLFSAFRRLKDRIEIMHQVFQIIETARMIGQTPTEAIAPLVEAAFKIQKDVSFLNNSTEMIPVLDNKDAMNLVSPDQVRMKDLTHHVMDTYNLMPYNTTGLQQESGPLSIPPAWLHSSLPVTPSTSAVQYTQFMSLPTSPTCQEEVESVETPCNSVQDMTLSPYHSPLNTTSSDMDDDEEYIVSEDNDGSDEEWKENQPKRKRQRNKRKINVVSTPRPIVFERQYTRRTATSYDAETTHYLKSIFFDIYSSRDKLTKDQRRQVQRETGLKPRNITYWFSNHKRRFQNSLLVFKKIVNESKGSVKNYNDFLLWRRSRGLSEDVLENEHLKILESLDHSHDEDEEDVNC